MLRFFTDKVLSSRVVLNQSNLYKPVPDSKVRAPAIWKDVAQNGTSLQDSTGGTDKWMSEANSKIHSTHFNTHTYVTYCDICVSWCFVRVTGVTSSKPGVPFELLQVSGCFVQVRHQCKVKPRMCFIAWDDKDEHGIQVFQCSQPILDVKIVFKKTTQV